MRRSTRLFVCAIATALAWFGGQTAHGQNIAVTVAAADSISADSRESITLPVRITNEGDQEQEVVTELVLPSGWQSITPPEAFRLSPGEQALALAAVQVGRRAAAGDHEIVIAVRDPDQKEPLAIHYVTVNVRPRPAVEVFVREQPDYVIAQTEYTLTFTLHNTGNTDLVYRPRLNTSGPGIVEIGDPSARSNMLAPGEQAALTATVRTGEEVRQPSTQRVELLVYDDDSGIRLGSATARTEIIPTVSEGVDPFRRFPIELGVGRMHRFDSSGYVGIYDFAAEGGGTLDTAGEHGLQFSFQKRLSSENEFAPFNREDRYHIGYGTGPFQVEIGDKNFTLSPLLEQQQLARGIELEHDLPRRQTQLYYHNTFLNQTPQHTVAGSAIFHPFYSSTDGPPNYELSVNALTVPPESVSVTTRHVFESPEGISVAAEAGFGGEFGESLGTAFDLEVTGNFDAAEARTNFLIAHPDFPGRLSDVLSFSGNGSLTLLNGALDLFAELGGERRNLAPGAEDRSARLSRTLSVGADYTFGGTRTKAGPRYHVQNTVDRLSPISFHTTDHRFGLSLRQPFDRFELRGEVEFTFERNIVQSSLLSEQHYSIGTNYAPSRAFSVDAELGYLHGASDRRYPQELSSAVSATYAQDRVDLTANTAAEVGFGASNQQSGRFSYGVGLDWTITSDDHMEFELNHVVRSSGGGLSSALEGGVWYSVDYGAPIARKPDIGALSGTITDAGTGAPIPDAVVRVAGFTAVSDSDGRYRFPALREGTHRLSIDAASISHSLVPMEKLPREVEIEGQRTHAVDIELAQGAALSGRIIRYEYPDAETQFQPEQTERSDGSGRHLREAEPLRGVTVTLSKDGTTDRRITGSDGSFRFAELPPGKWRINLSANAIPAQHEYERNDFEISLEPGESREIEIRVIPKERPIQFLEEERTLGGEE